MGVKREKAEMHCGKGAGMQDAVSAAAMMWQ